MKRLFTIFATLLATLSLSANNVVTLAVSGQGATKEEATANALRSAIEQAYGVFVSANTTILNDELVRDEIATVASGNIEKFEEISYVTTSNGEAFVTLSATVAISKLQAYAKSKGSSTEFAGATFAMNMKMRELNKENEQKALVNMYYQLQELAPNVFDWELTAGYPTIQKDKNYKVPMTLTAKPNDASEAFYNILTNTLNSLSLTPTEIEEYKQVGLETFTMQTPQKVVVLRNNPEKFMAYLGYLVYCIESSYRIKQLSADGQTFYAKKAGQKAAVNFDYDYYSQWKGYYKNAGFDAYKKDSNSNIVVRPDVLVGHDEMMILQGFEVEHTPVNRITFKYDDNGDIWASDVVVCQDVKGYEFDRYRRGLWDKLDNITISDGVTSIGNYAFRDCSSLTSITIPVSVTSIGWGAFYDCKWLKSITIPDSVTSIGGCAFYECKSLASVTIPDSVTSIGDDAFYGCTGELIINSKIVETNYTTSNYPSYYSWLDGAKFSKLTIGNGVTKIGNYAFSGCSSLKSITIPDGVTSIGEDAFKGCTSLKSVHITDIAAWCRIIFGDGYANPLYYAHNLYLNGELVTNLVIPDSVTSIGGSAFGGYSSLTSITIPDSVTKIGKCAFEGCTSLTSITIPDGVTEIGNYAFYGCTGELIINSKIVETNYTTSNYPSYYSWLDGAKFSKLTIGNGVTKIGESAFRHCTSLTSITIPDSVTSIGKWAFYECSSLTSITIPDSVTSIGEDAFADCRSLTSVYCKAVTPPAGGSNMVEYSTPWLKIYVPTESVDAYKAAKYWINYRLSIYSYDF